MISAVDEILADGFALMINGGGTYEEVMRCEIHRVDLMYGFVGIIPLTCCRLSHPASGTSLVRN
jgi:hypothetical protein